MTATDRQLAWAACLNVRDLGGLRTYDGRVTKHGVLVRGSMIGSLTPEGESAMRVHGVRSIVDLRWPAEVEAQPSMFARGVAYRNVPVDSDRRLALADQLDADAMLAHLGDLASPASGIRDAIGAIAESEPAVLIHCQAGRDRTGIVVALILALVGVMDEDIEVDYRASDDALAPEYARFRAEQPEVAAAIPGAIERRMRAMGHVLRAMRTGYGDAAGYLEAVGVAEESRDRLRRMLVA